VSTRAARCASSRWGSRSGSPRRAQEVADGFHTTPSLFWKSGDHRVDLGAAFRFRTELWDAFADDVEAYTGLRTRVRVQYGWRERLLLVAEFQDVHLYGMDPDGSGALANYRNANDGQRSASGQDLRLLYAEVRPTPKSYLRVGRQEMKLGPEVVYPEPDWRYLKTARVSERLLGSVGWSHESAPATASAPAGTSAATALRLAARPTQGVFAVETAYRPLHDIATRRILDREARHLAAGHRARRLRHRLRGRARPDEGGLAHGVESTRWAATPLGVYALGPGKVDAVLWGAGQLGDYNDLDHRAGAVIAELGYQLPELFAKPWLRVGVNAASGDGDPGDGDHHTFFNLLPTNHIYYGFADQLVPEPDQSLRAAPRQPARDADAQLLRALVPAQRGR
jgi:hypothetical protein